jgi:drug/metabolite transporter (DMT)-like permease
MRRWLILLGGLLFWATHFLGLYLITSVADVVATADDPVWRLAGAGFSLVCIAGAAGLGVAIARAGRRGPQPDPRRFEHSVALGGCVIGGIGVAFQTLALLIVG